MEERKRKKAIYARKSKYTGKGESIENQIDTCKHYLKTYFDINITDDDIIVYNDEGYTGANTERPHFKEMMKAIKNNEIDTIICYRLDRISRNVLDFANLSLGLVFFRFISHFPLLISEMSNFSGLITGISIKSRST